MFSLKDIVWVFKGISTFALVGDSGTGKSFRAKLLAQKYNIDVIIDDGLLIKDEKILAGHSAKREKTYMGAIRAALFDDKSHRDEVAKVLQKLKVKRILILGTSEKMAQKIAVRLQLPPPPQDNIIHIEEIASQEEIDKAIRSRRVEGKHVIPVPAVEIKRNYPMIFFDAIRIFHKKKNAASADAAEKLYEKSVVRPEFSKKGRISISEAALTQMVMHCVMEYDKAVRVKKLGIKTDRRGYRLIITVDVPFGTQLIGEIHNLQEYIIDNIEKYTGILIEEVSIVIDKITQAGKI
jgi:adenylate kinase family enzyme/uncharacterized alkaline shock family protein YloU